MLVPLAIPVPSSSGAALIWLRKFVANHLTVYKVCNVGLPVIACPMPRAACPRLSVAHVHGPCHGPPALSPVQGWRDAPPCPAGVPALLTQLLKRRTWPDPCCQLIAVGYVAWPSFLYGPLLVLFILAHIRIGFLINVCPAMWFD